MADDETWFERTYPLPAGNEAVSERELIRVQDRLCLERLEQICWGGKAVCPKCSKRNAYTRSDGPRGRGWHCRECRKRFYVLAAIPGMTSTHQPMQKWFRAMYLLRDNPRLIPSDLVRRLETQWKYAKHMRETIVRLQTENPELVRRVVDGLAADQPNALRRPKKERRVGSSPAPSDEERDEENDELDKVETGWVPRRPSAFDLDC